MVMVMVRGLVSGIKGDGVVGGGITLYSNSSNPIGGMEEKLSLP